MDEAHVYKFSEPTHAWFAMLTSGGGAAGRARDTPLARKVCVLELYILYINTLNSDANTERRRRRFGVITIRPIIRSAYD